MLRSVDVAVTPAVPATRAPAAVAVVIDVLRATSTIVTALANGAAGVVPVREPDDAIAVMRRLGRERVLLCGERDARAIAGFDLDNSPASYTAAAVSGKTLAFTTTNGTRALIEATRFAPRVLCGALLNRRAIAAALLAAGTGDALLICAGDEGALSFEDFVCAGAIVAALHGEHPELARTDAARAAAALYESVSRRLTTALAGGTHAKTLRDAGFSDDIAACARIDTIDVAPSYADGMITRASGGRG